MNSDSYRRYLTMCTALALSSSLAIAGVCHADGSRKPIHLLAANGKLTGTSLSTSIPGYSGSGYAAGFTSNADQLAFQFPARAGLYRITIRYSSPDGPKGYGMVVDGQSMSGMFTATGQVWANCDAGIVRLNNGENTLSIGGGWNYYDIDEVTLQPTSPMAPPKLPSTTLSDPKATPQARALFHSLISMYGKQTGSGCYSMKDVRYIYSKSGREPMILGGDLIDYSPSRIAHGANPAGTVQKLIADAHKGYDITLSWHWNAPMHLIDKSYIGKDGKLVVSHWWSGFYTYATTFNVKQALADHNSPEYKALLQNIGAIAIELKKFQAANIPILWRPLHEAEGGWFWWGAQGPEAFKQLWHLLYNRLTNYYGIHNLIWVYTSGGNMNWYPGDKYVDVVGVDAYPKSQDDPLTSLYQQMMSEFNGRKLLAISEFGGVPNIPLMRSYGEYWDYFVSWGGTTETASDKALKRTYTSKYVKDHPAPK